MIKNTFADTIRRILYVSLGKLDMWRGVQPPLITILCYHSIADDHWAFSTPLSDFKKHITLLAKQYDFISLSELALFFQGKQSITSPSIVVTFDDGYQNILSAVPILKKYGIKPTVFLLSDPSHANRKELDSQLPFLNSSDLKVLSQAGWEFGSHTATHPDLWSCSPTALNREIVLSKSDLEKKIGNKINWIAYPKGRYSPQILKKVRQAKYTLGLSMDDGVITKKSNLLAIPRIGINRTHSLGEIETMNYQLPTLLRQTLKRFIK